MTLQRLKVSRYGGKKVLNNDSNKYTASDCHQDFYGSIIEMEMAIIEAVFIL